MNWLVGRSWHLDLVSHPHNGEHILKEAGLSLNLPMCCSEAFDRLPLLGWSVGNPCIPLQPNLYITLSLKPMLFYSIWMPNTASTWVPTAGVNTYWECGIFLVNLRFCAPFDTTFCIGCLFLILMENQVFVLTTKVFVLTTNARNLSFMSFLNVLLQK